MVPVSTGHIVVQYAHAPRQVTTQGKLQHRTVWELVSEGPHDIGIRVHDEPYVKATSLEHASDGPAESTSKENNAWVTDGGEGQGKTSRAILTCTGGGNERVVGRGTRGPWR